MLNQAMDLLDAPKALLQVKVFEFTGTWRICWLLGTSLAAENVVGARIRLMEQVPALTLTHFMDTDVVFVVDDTKFPAHEAVSTLFGMLLAQYE